MTNLYTLTMDDLPEVIKIFESHEHHFFKQLDRVEYLNTYGATSESYFSPYLDSNTRKTLYGYKKDDVLVGYMGVYFWETEEYATITKFHVSAEKNGVSLGVTMLKLLIPILKNDHSIKRIYRVAPDNNVRIARLDKMNNYMNDNGYTVKETYKIQKNTLPPQPYKNMIGGKPLGIDMCADSWALDYD